MAGPVRFDDWVDGRLYGPDGFYETGGQAGRRGDFLTSPEVGPLFGVLVGRALDRWWDDLGQPAPFVVAEAAAGRGALAISVLRSRPRCGSALRYVTVERSAALRELQRAALGESVERRADLPTDCSVILANELLDNLAFRLFERTSGGWAEVWVENGQPVLVDADAVSPVLDGVDVTAGARLPRLERAAEWVGDARRRAPIVCCIDYGVDRTAELAARAWLRTYRGHQVGSDPFLDDAPVDITTDIALDQLPAPTSVQRQAGWLRELGIDELVDEGRDRWTRRAGIADLEAIEMRSRVREADALIAPDGLGGFLVMEWTAR